MVIPFLVCIIYSGRNLTTSSHCKVYDQYLSKATTFLKIYWHIDLRLQSTVRRQGKSRVYFCPRILSEIVRNIEIFSEIQMSEIFRN